MNSLGKRLLVGLSLCAGSWLNPTVQAQSPIQPNAVVEPEGLPVPMSMGRFRRGRPFSAAYQRSWMEHELYHRQQYVSRYAPPPQMYATPAPQSAAQQPKPVVAAPMKGPSSTEVSIQRAPSRVPAQAQPSPAQLALQVLNGKVPTASAKAPSAPARTLPHLEVPELVSETTTTPVYRAQVVEYASDGSTCPDGACGKKPSTMIVARPAPKPSITSVKSTASAPIFPEELTSTVTLPDPVDLEEPSVPVAPQPKSPRTTTPSTRRLARSNEPAKWQPIQKVGAVEGSSNRPLSVEKVDDSDR